MVLATCILHEEDLDHWSQREERGFKKIGTKTDLHPVGFEPTSTNTPQLECGPLDQLGQRCFIFKLRQIVLYKMY